MNVTERESSVTQHDPRLPELVAAPLCLALDIAGLAWQTAATAVDIGDRIGCWVWLAFRHIPKPPDL